MSGDPLVQFDGLYKIAYVFGSVLEFNEPPSSVPLLREHDHFFRDYFRDYAPATTRK